MAQNLKKWLWKGHGLQKWNVLKYFWLTMAPICLIVYLEAHDKRFKKAYYVFKIIGTCHKVCWDFRVDWGLFQARQNEKTPWGLRDKRSFSACTYYLCMLFDIFGLFFWAIVLYLYSAFSTQTADKSLASLEFYSNVMWITWAEMFVYAARRTVWTFVRVEAEYHGNMELYRDIVTVPPMAKETS